MKEDLELEAIKVFPVLYNEVVGIYKNKSNGNIIFVDNIQQKALTKDWLLICTREQHIRRRMEMFEGESKYATHTAPSINGKRVFYKIKSGNDGYEFKMEFSPNKWLFCSHGSPYFSPLIPRPTQAELDYISNINIYACGPEGKIVVGNNADLKECTESEIKIVNSDDGVWVPEVGRECEIAKSYSECMHKYSEGHIVKIYSKFKDDRGIELFAFVDSRGKVGGIGSAKLFRPLKTEAEKENEELMRMAYKVVSGEEMGSEDYDLMDLVCTINALLDADMIRRPTE